MSLLNDISNVLFGRKEASSADTAKDRLRVLLINDRVSQQTPEFLPQLRQEIIAVLKKYVPMASADDVNVEVSSNENVQMMEFSISIDSNHLAEPDLSGLEEKQ
ncbi:MAG: cell division topological specificity factor MinE, partial [Succinivibrionaceae bacterium]|nr:cell division topological specificity factor MinE [Succinivibrionaceae bacterium]